jgi:epoxyqueuosine reductase
MAISISEIRHPPEELDVREGVPSREDRIRAVLQEAGFDAVGFARVDDFGPVHAGRLAEFLDAGHHATMHWLARDAARRSHPRALWPDACSAIVVGLNYGPDFDPLAVLGQPDRGAISVYARARDYHDVLKGILKQAASKVAVLTGKAELKVFVDTAPLMEKPLAALAGIGWQGRHTNLVSRDLGSWLFLGVILTAAELRPDPPSEDRCGSCRRCLDICPTDAFPAPYRLDARRCISYLTIEHAGPIDRALRPAIGNRIYGCDDCLAVCPWNKFAEAAAEARLTAGDAVRAPPLGELLALDDPAFRRRFAGSPVKRTGRDRFVRNVLIAAGNSGRHDLLPAVEALLADPAPVVRGAAVWAVARLAGPARIAEIASVALPGETDPDVLDEWQTELHP